MKFLPSENLEENQISSRKFPETPQSDLHSSVYILAKGRFKQWKIAIDNGWPVLYSGFGGGAYTTWQGHEPLTRRVERGTNRVASTAF
jgi:hypothetical protein